MKLTLFNITKPLPLLLLVLVTIGFYGCKSTRDKAKSTSAEPMLLYLKTPCYGMCPSYEALIHTDGFVRYIGREHVPVTDTLTFWLTKAETQNLKETIAGLGYNNLEGLYKTQWTDKPSTHLYFYEAGKEVKHIKHQEGGPEELIQFNEMLHELIWQKMANTQK